MAVQTVAAGSYGSTADDGEWREKPSQEKLSADDLAAILRVRILAFCVQKRAHTT
jgi:hypothetical protein